MAAPPIAIRDGSDNTLVQPLLVKFRAILEAGNVQPSVPASSHYAADPTDRCSRLIHKYEVDGRGYAFPYDDVNAGNGKASENVSSG
ncbi:hypothetical protein NHJ13734_004276 [Beauveria thailandica]